MIHKTTAVGMVDAIDAQADSVGEAVATVITSYLAELEAITSYSGLRTDLRVTTSFEVSYHVLELREGLVGHKRIREPSPSPLPGINILAAVDGWPLEYWSMKHADEWRRACDRAGIATPHCYVVCDAGAGPAEEDMYRGLPCEPWWTPTKKEARRFTLRDASMEVINHALLGEHIGLEVCTASEEIYP